MRKTLLILFASIFIYSCTDATRSKIGGIGQEFTVKVLGPDTIITYHSSGKVVNESNTDGYYFNEKETGKLIEISGTIIIEEK
jgi:hypothetical protein